MIHELDFLDLVSFFIQEKNNCNLGKKDIEKIKKGIEEKYASIEIKITSSSIERFAERYKSQVTISEETISITMDKTTSQQIVSLRSPYMEDNLKRFLQENDYL